MARFLTKRATWLGASVALATVLAAAGAGSPVRASAGAGYGAHDRPATKTLGAADPLASLGPVLAAALAPPEYHLAPGAQGWQADNSRQGLAVGFSAHGLSVAPVAGGPGLGLSLARLGRPGSFAPPGPATIAVEGARIDYRRGDVTEWYVNEPRGVEQGFTLAAPPPGSRSRPVVVELAPTGGLVPTLAAGGSAVRFTAPGGATLAYDGLHAFDAAGRALPARMALEAGKVQLHVDDAGAAYPLTIDPWVHDATLLHPAGAPFDQFGSSVAVSGDTAVVGAPLDDTTAGASAGSTHVFLRTGGTWSHQATLLHPFGAAGDEFGASVAVSGDIAVVGAPFDDTTAGTDAGSAHVFVRTGGTWSHQATLLHPAGAAGDWFGESVAVSGDTAVVGARLDNTTAGTDAGSAHVFVRTGGTWSHQATLLHPAGAADDAFGYSVAVSGDTAVVGAPSDNTTALGDSGSAHVFVRTGGTWSHRAALLHPAAAPSDFFGWSVAVSGDTAVVGAPQDNTTAGTDAGSAHVFVRTGGTWSHEAPLAHPAGAAIDLFGQSVAVSGDTAVVAAPTDDTAAGTNAGSAHVFRLEVKATPSISTRAAPGGMVGTPVRDVATLAGGLNPTGTVTFALFSNDTCTTQVFTSTNPVTGGTTATSDWFTPAAAGTYYWTAVYSGDANNSPATSPCGAPNESVTITPFAPPAPTQTITGDFLGPLTVNAGQSVLITNARVVGPVTVNPGGALTVVDSQISRGITADAPAFFSLCGSQVSGPAPAVALSVTNATVPIRVGDPAAGCAGNRFAGQVNLSDNLAVTFGANTVSHNATVDANGPGNTVIKANTVYATLACSANVPAPTNAGQPNTAGAKTGQCAAL
jgi:hypothetical protein